MCRAGCRPALPQSDGGARVIGLPASPATGLEYDDVVVVEPEAIVAGESSLWQRLRRLYPVPTRAVAGHPVEH